MGGFGDVERDGYGGSEVRVNRDGLALKGSADEGSVSFFDMKAV